MMTMWPRSGRAIPAGTAQVARAAFPNGCLAIRIREALGELFEDAQFAGLFATRGRPAVSPARLALVLVLQFAEGLSDRQAADAVRGRIDWKYALGLELSDTGFDASVLSEFRARLLGDGQPERLLGAMLDQLRERGLLVRGGRQRTDATHVLAAVRELNRLELVIETLRATLEALATVAPRWLAALAPEDWYQRYGQRASDWRLPQAETARAALAATVGIDGYVLLEAVYATDPDTPQWLRQVPAVQTLRAMWLQQYYRDQHGVRWRGKAERPPAILAIRSPYDTEARYGIKRGMEWRGYKAHFTETCEPDRPHLIVHVTTTVATAADVDTVAARHADLAKTDLLPEEHLVDAGYVSVDHILAARAEHDVELVGPLPPDAGWQAREQEGFDLTRFAIDWDRQQVTCPNGKTSRNWHHSRSRQGLPIVQVSFRAADCTPCPDRARCTRSPTNGRGLTFRPRAQYETQRQLRAEQATAGWQERYAHRSGVEGTIAQASRRGDLHHARYRGLAKTHLQHVLTALALNLIRVDAWLTGTPLGGSWASRLTRLQAAPSPM
jgi:transposase